MAAAAERRLSSRTHAATVGWSTILQGKRKVEHAARGGRVRLVGRWIPQGAWQQQNSQAAPVQRQQCHTWLVWVHAAKPGLDLLVCRGPARLQREREREREGEGASTIHETLSSLCVHMHTFKTFSKTLGTFSGVQQQGLNTRQQHKWRASRNQVRLPAHQPPAPARPPPRQPPPPGARWQRAARRH